jgi:pimeloyl-ACP methyl ester carboxylesterase
VSTWLLLRGLTREARHWGSFPQRLRAALPGAAVIALDLPGNGRLNGQVSPMSVAAMVQALRDDLPRRGIEPPLHLLAMSLGGMVAIDWAMRHPHEIAGAVLINTSAGGLLPFHRRLLPSAWLPLLRCSLPGLDDAQREQLIAALTTRSHPAGAPPEWLALRRSHPVSRRNAWRQWVAAWRFDAPTQPPPVPLLLLGSAHDRLVDPRCSQRLAQAWGASHAEHSGAGHDLAFDDADWLVRAIQRWLKASRI